MYYRQPKYYAGFRCTGGNCINDCCYGWRIDWTMEEVEKIKNAPNCSHELRQIIKKMFISNTCFENIYQVNFDDNEKCPCVTEEGLCRIQKELGAEYLSRACAKYPRMSIFADNVLYRGCHMTCSEVIKSLLNDDRAMDMISMPPKEVITHTNIDTAEKLKEHPELALRGTLLEFYYDLIADKKLSLKTAVILGALTAQKLTQIVDSKEYDIIPNALKRFRKQFHNSDQLKIIDNIKPNYYMKLAFLTELTEQIINSGATSALHDQTGTVNIDLYNKGEKRLEEILKGREYFLRNLALNLLFELFVPFRFEEKTIFENYSLYVTSLGLIDLNLISIGAIDSGITVNNSGQEFTYYGDDRLIGMTAIICRKICQTERDQRIILALLQKYNITSPAYLALLVK